jgi:hypothetical protein
MRDTVDGALQLGDQFGNGAVQVVSDVTNGPPVARLLRMNPEGLKQHGGGNVVGMGDKRDRHPGLDGLIFGADLPSLPAGPGGEDESTSDCQHEGQPNRQCPPPCFSHASIVAGFVETESKKERIRAQAATVCRDQASA